MPDADLDRNKPDLIVHSAHPFNAEPPLDRLRASFVTPQRGLYVRSHGAIPALDAASHRVSVGGRVASRLELSVADLRRRFPERTVTAVLQCAGNRRGDLAQVRPVSGDPWSAGAIGNVAWTGVSLADVLHAAGTETSPAMHVAFAACDECEVEGERFRYGASIPMSKALGPEVLLAWQANGEALAPEHGFPIRVVVPGFAGARSPKWLAAIEVRDTPSEQSHPGARLQAAATRRHQGDGRLGQGDHGQRDAAELRHLRAGAARSVAGRSDPPARLGGRERSCGRAGRRDGRCRSDLAAGGPPTGCGRTLELDLLGRRPRPPAGRP